MIFYIITTILFFLTGLWYGRRSRRLQKNMYVWALAGVGIFGGIFLLSFVILAWIVASAAPEHIQYEKLRLFSLVITVLVTVRLGLHYLPLPRKRLRKPHFNWLMKFQSVIALILMIIVMTILSDKFFTTENGWNVMRQISVNICLSVGMTLVILTGGIDLSVGSVLALSGVVVAGLLKNGTELPIFNTYIAYTFVGAVSIGIFVGLMLGFFNGWVITTFRIPPFVATLGMLTIARGLTMLWTGGHPITKLGESFAFLGTGWFLGIPMPVWISVGIVALAVLMEKKTRLGRYIYAVGGNEKAARLSGLNVERIKLCVYTIAGGLAAVGGLLVTSRLDSAQPNAGISYELDSIAAVVIGGTSLSGGRGSITGTVIGAMIIGILSNGLVLNDVSPFWQQVIKGSVILLAVAIDKFNTKES